MSMIRKLIVKKPHENYFSMYILFEKSEVAFILRTQLLIQY